MTDDVIQELLAEEMARSTGRGARTVGELAQAITPLVLRLIAHERKDAAGPFLKLAREVDDGWAPSASRLADAIRRVAG